MKKALILSLSAFVILVSASSCKKCYKCQEIGGTYTEEICKPSGFSQSEWKTYVKNYEVVYGAQCE